MSEYRDVEPAPRLRGAMRVPGDKSTSHRTLMVSALANGESTIDGLSSGLDVAASAAIVVQLGAVVRRSGDLVIVTGPTKGLRPGRGPLDCGNSGTTMRLMAGIVSALPGEHVLVGDASLTKRPMDRVAIPLTRMGAVVVGEGPRVNAPLHITGSTSLRAIDYRVPIASAQVKSALLFAGLSAHGTTTVVEDIRTRSTTEDMFRAAGIDIRSVDDGLGRRVVLAPGRPAVRHWSVPGDPSQAAFFAVLGSIHPDARVEILDVAVTPERIGYVGVLQRMGAQLTLSTSGETATLLARSSLLTATEIDAEEIPSVDEVPVLVVAASAAQGISAFRRMGELRLKESDRFAGSMSLAAALGCRVWSDGDDFFVEGRSSAAAFDRFDMDAGLDHRMVMASAVAAAAGRGCTIGGADTVSSSYPHFFRDLETLSE